MKFQHLFFVVFLLIFSCGDCPRIYSYQPPHSYDDGLVTGSANDLGMDTTYLNQLMDCIYANKFDQVHSILVYKDDRLIFEEYTEGNKYQWDGQYYCGERIKWHKDTMHMTMSTTKSITSAIVGTAIDREFFDVNESIFKYLPDHQEFNTGGREKITIEHLLTMTSGLEWDEWSGAHSTNDNDIDKIYFHCQDDPLACVLGRELVAEPGTRFTYSGGNMIVLGEVLKNAVGKNILEFGYEHLFRPLGIDSVFWYQFKNGAFACDGWIKMTPRDMLKIGITFLNNGVWKGERLLSEDWIKRSKTAYRNNTGIDIPLDDTGKNDYGYTWWINEVSSPKGKMKIFQASGWGGQEIIVIPELEMVVVFTGGNYAVKKHIHKMLENYILKAVK